jgi:hypothetical protein
VARNTRDAFFALHTRETHKTILSNWAWVSVQPIMARMTTPAPRTGGARRPSDGDLFLNVTVELFDSSEIAIKTVNLGIALQ